MNRKLFRVTGGLMILLIGCLTMPTSISPTAILVPTIPGTPPPTAIPFPIPSVPPPPTISKPTPEVIVSTSARQLSVTESAAQMALPVFAMPDGMYFVVRDGKTEETCMNNCRCPEPMFENWNELGTTQQQQIMQEMIIEGAKGFVIRTDDTRIRGCACTIDKNWIEPIKQLPITLENVTLYRVDRDGTIIANTGNQTFAFKPGDTWSHITRTTITNSRDLVLCQSFTHSTSLFFQNTGLVSIAVPPTRMPSPTITPIPTATPPPIARWVEQAIPEDTEIKYYWDDGNGSTGLSIRIQSNGNVSCEKRDFDARTIQNTKMAVAELKQLLLKFAEIDFFAMITCGHGCVYYSTQPFQLPTRPYCVVTDFDIEQIQFTIQGLRHNLWLGRGGCDSPGDPRAQQRLDQLVAQIRSACPKMPTPTPDR